MTTSRIILHGKQSTNAELREAVATVRDEGHEIDVRVTWEGGDAGRLAAEAAAAGVDRVIAGGGDGTVNEVLTGLVGRSFGGVLGVLPLGTANDFAMSAGISTNLAEALRTAVSAEPTTADFGLDRFDGRERPFLNVATGGFGTEVTVNTDPRLKKHLGGAAYLLTGVQRFGSLRGERCTVQSPDGAWEGELLVLAIGNGRQAGGGHQLCPRAIVNDGWLDVTVMPFLTDKSVSEALQLLLSPKMEQARLDTLVQLRVPWVEVAAEAPMTVNLDGEPVQSTQHRFEAQAGALRLALPPACPLLEE